MKKSTIYIIAILVIMLAIIVFTILTKTGVIKKNNSLGTKNTNMVTNVEVNTENTNVTNIEKNNTQVIENKENTTILPPEPEPTTSREDKAINIVKGDLNKDTTLLVAVDYITDDGHVICKVTDPNTMNVVAFYNVDVEAGTFTK